jgi:M6 family metalloprotease-like protein
MKRARVSFLAILGVLLLSGCGPQSGNSENHSLSSEKGDSQETPDSSASSKSEGASSASSSSAVPTKATITGIEAVDNMKNYMVGETFNSVADLTINLLFSDGSKKDISKKPSYYAISMKDPSGDNFNPVNRFTKTGTYTFQLTYKGNTSLSTNVLSFTVEEQTSQKLTAKAPENTTFSYRDLDASCLDSYCLQPQGNVPVLVIPVEFTDYPFSKTPYGADYLSAINRAFNGKGKSETGYWESVASYYQKASVGKLNLSFDVAPAYEMRMTTSQFLNSGGTAVSAGQSAVQDYLADNGSTATQKYDLDHDGYMDSVWFVYSAPDFTNGSYSSNVQDIFWAFCTSGGGQASNVESPGLHNLAWASVDFLYDQIAAPAVDPHVWVHETGHLLSLPDYYSYDMHNSAVTTGPQGGLCMMDLNIGDQDSFSKMALGWVTPYVVTDSCTVTIKPNESSGDCIVLADHWNGTAFDEYLVLDLQTPTGVNESDASASYNTRPMYYSYPGIRMLHVDSRLGAFSYDAPSTSDTWTNPIKNSVTGDYYCDDGTVESLVKAGTNIPRIGSTTVTVGGGTTTTTCGYTIINANSASRSRVQEAPYTTNRQLSLIGADGLNCEIDDTYGSNDSLFKTGDSWSMAKKGTNFFGTIPGKFNNGNLLRYAFTVLSCDMNSATIQFRKY